MKVEKTCRLWYVCFVFCHWQVENNYRHTVCDAVDANGYDLDIFKAMIQIAFMAQGASSK